MWRSSLILLCLASSSLASGPAQGTRAPGTLLSWEARATGFGLTVDDAKKDALKHVIDKMTAVLRRQDPPLLAWEPTPEHVKSHVLQDEGAAGPDVELGNGVISKSWVYPLKPLDLDLLRGLDHDAQRAQRRDERVDLGMRVFGVLGLVLGAWVVLSRKRCCSFFAGAPLH